MPSTCKNWITLDLKLLSGVWLKPRLLFGIQVLWKNVYLKRIVKQRTAALCGPWGYKHWQSLCRKHISRGCKICLWAIFPFMWRSELPTRRWTVYCSFAKTYGWKKKQSLSWGFAFIWVSSNLKKVRDRDMDCFYPCLHPSFISSSDHLSHPSLCQAPGGHSLFSVLRGPVFSGCWQHVADRLCSLFSFTTVRSPASASILNASKTSRTVQQTKTQPQLTEWTAGLQPERSLILCV